MRYIIARSFHFNRDDSMDSMARQRLEETLNMLAVTPRTQNEQRSLAALFNGFTTEQWIVVRKLVERAIEERRTRHINCVTESAYSRAVIEQLRQIIACWAQVSTEIDHQMDAALTNHHTGLLAEDQPL